MDHAAVRFTWLSLAVLIPPTCYIYAAAWNLSDSPVTKCGHPFTDKIRVITEYDVPNTWLLGLGSKSSQEQEANAWQRSYSGKAESFSSIPKSSKWKKGPASRLLL